MAELDDLVKEFLIESGENLDRLDQDFVALEQDVSATDRLGSIFRTIHTIKGTCGFLGLHKLEGVTHVGESLLSRLRDGEMTANSEIISGLLAMVDAVREILTNIESSGTEGNGDYTKIIENLTRLKDAGSGAPAVPIPVRVPTPPVIKTPAASAAAAPVAAPVDASSAPAAETDEHPEHAAPEPQADHAITTSSEPDVHAPPAKPAVAPTDASKHAEPAGAGGIRVDVGLLDRLMNLVGELVLARNQILQFSGTLENATLSGSTQRLNLITTELQEGVMKTRMQPIGNVWSKFPRIVRDLSQICGKKVRVEMEGPETELDKTIIEAIKDPLTHIIRNSVDHGIENPEKRLACGKDAEGRLFLRAFHEGGQVNIEIIDDGGGIHLDRVKAKAIERSLITAEQAARMTEREALNLIFLPGFSTAEKITNVSGRGVGMDVVKTNIEKIGGTVDLQSKLGEGTTLRIRIPLTLAIIPALVITSGGDRFAIPQVSLLELVRLEPDAARKGIESIRGTPVYRLRGDLLPLVHLNKQLRTETADNQGDGTVNIVVLQADERQFGLVVDEINDTEEIVVKPLGKLFKGLTTFAGATIMGDGRVALILDVMGLAQRSNVVSDNKDRSVHEMESRNKDAGSTRQAMLLFQVSENRRMAVPLSQVARLEEFPRSAIEYSGDQQVVQYRSQIMPLISLTNALADSRLRLASAQSEGQIQTETIQVIVYTRDESSVGLVVDRIMDVVEETLVMQRNIVRPGVLGSAVIEKKVTELLDVEAVIRTVLPGAINFTPARAA
jgi:two-component system chemotaxis sensor kinase CheA